MKPLADAIASAAGRWSAGPAWLSDDTLWRVCDRCAERVLRGRPCPICEEQDDLARRERARLAALRADRAGALRRAGVPDALLFPFVDLAGGWPRDRRAPHVDLGAWAGDPWSVLLVGAVGAGKSTLAAELAFRALLRGGDVRFIRACDVVPMVFGGERWEQERLQRVGLLVLDDLGRGHPGGGWEAIAEVVAHRHGRRRATAFTSNLDLERMAAEGDLHLADRLREGLVVELSGGSRRRLEVGA